MSAADIGQLEKLAKLVRYYILLMTTEAGSGHPTSSLSAADLATALFFGKLGKEDRLIFSKGHASPLLYALYGAAGLLSEKELLTYRKFGSRLQGHPMPDFEYVQVATGSLGQGLSIGLGMALGMRLGFQVGAEVGLSARRIAGPVSRFLPASAHSSLKSQGEGEDKVELRAGRGPSTTATRNSLTSDIPTVYVLMGDSEMAEGSVWEACQLASYYKAGNLAGIIDVNRLGQSGETMLGWEVSEYKRRVEAFGWEAHVVDGHDMEALVRVFESISGQSDRPQMIISKTIKGKGVSFLENKEGWHGKALSKEDFEKAVGELGMAGPVSGYQVPVAGLFTFEVKSRRRSENTSKVGLGTYLKTQYTPGEMVATRKAFGETLAKLGEENPNIVSLDAEVKNSTFAEIFKEKFPERFFECFIAEQNMVGMALGMSKRGLIPFVSTFAVFLTRAFDQIRMAAYSRPNIKFVGSHAGVSIGEDGPSQMALEDLAMFRSVFGSVVLVPGDAVACARLVALAAGTGGLFYIRTNRLATPVIYYGREQFKIGGSRVVRSFKVDRLTVAACGVALVEAIAAADELVKEGICVRVIDAYSVKPIDEAGLKKAASETNNIVITVEDHYFEGGLGDAVLNVFAGDGDVKVHKLAVTKMPMSGKPQELLDYEGISAKAIAAFVRKVIKTS